MVPNGRNSCIREDYDKLIYTGRIDEFFKFKFGELPYRSLKFEHIDYDKEYFQKWCQINYPNDYDYTRIVEIKHATGQICPNTTIVKEYPEAEGEPYYPIPNQDNEKLYVMYKNEEVKVVFLGRLAQYKYLNMDQVVKNALDLFNEIEK